MDNRGRKRKLNKVKFFSAGVRGTESRERVVGEDNMANTGRSSVRKNFRS